MYLSANSGIAFDYNGVNLTGPKIFMKTIADMASILAELKARTGYLYNGYRDIAEDVAGNAYYITTYGPSITKITRLHSFSIYHLQLSTAPRRQTGASSP
jgi:hypothetical protein